MLLPSNLLLFETRKRVPPDTPIREDDLNVIQALDNTRTAVSEGGVRKLFTFLLTDEDEPVYIWCNMNIQSLEKMGIAMGRKSEEIRQYVLSKSLETNTGVGD